MDPSVNEASRVDVALKTEVFPRVTPSLGLNTLRWVLRAPSDLSTEGLVRFRARMTAQPLGGLFSFHVGVFPP